MYDAIVIGSRCAGAPTAMLLARRGRRVLLVDRASFPSDVLSGHSIQPAGVALLQKWGLLDRVRATGAPFTSDVRFDFGPVVLHGTPAPIDGVTATVCIRRTILDTLLADAAVEAGAELRQQFHVTDLLWDDGRVVGVRGRGADGQVVDEHAPIVIGADGANSFVARAVTAACYHRQPAATFAIYSYWHDLDVRAVELYTRPGRFAVALPTNDDLVIVAQEFPVAEAHRARHRVEQTFAETMSALPHLAARMGGATRVDRFRFASVGDSLFRQPGGPGWALVGDAGYHKDPITAEGMYDAFRDAELLADAVDQGLEHDLDGELRRYQQARDEAARPMYEFTCGLAHLEQPPPPEMLSLIADLADQPREIRRFFGLIAGSVRVPDFFDPANLARIATAARSAA